MSERYTQFETFDVLSTEFFVVRLLGFEFYDKLRRILAT